jgi:MFS family permease
MCTTHTSETVINKICTRLSLGRHPRPRPDSTEVSAKTALARGTLYVSVSLGLLVVATSLGSPHQQSHRDALGCDSACLGALTSGRGLLKLIGAAVVGRISDMPGLEQYGGARRICLLMGIVAAAVGLLVANQAQTLTQLRWSLVPLALEQNLSVLKALMGEYHELVPHNERRPDDCASSAGKLGMAVGLAMMIGPLAGTILLKTYDQATQLGLVVLLIAAVLIFLLPPTIAKKIPAQSRSVKSGIRSFVDIPIAQTPAVLFLLSSRLLSTLAFHIYQTILTTSLRERFDFGPKDYGVFFSVIGLFFSLSQGFGTKILLERFGSTPRRKLRLILICTFFIGAMRYGVFYTSSLSMLYVFFALMITAYGVNATVFTADASRLAPPDARGGFFGLIGAVEQGAGMVGPLLGGALTLVHTTKAPLFAVLAFHAANFVLIALFYDKLILKRLHDDDLLTSDTKRKAD